MSVLLALDSSTEHMALALVGQGHAAFVDADGGAQASQHMVPDALALLREAGVALPALDAIAFGRGPGAFTGLRTACSVAQGLAFGANKPVLALDSLMLVAEDARQQWAAQSQSQAPSVPPSQSPAAGWDVWVAMDARMNQIYAGRYRWEGQAWTVLDAPMLVDAAALQQLWAEQPAACVAGSALVAMRLDGGPALRIEHTHSRARALGALAMQAWDQGLAEDASQALPLYVRDKVAQTTAEREAAKATAGTAPA
ncbi:tRNA threonylcarbamoyladenosine biosynthesis protein TsaB [Roseateles sp. YR242]|uniref:tRNA (adenosine(37)-N6)-threonylcarbamoyltransferase complex dimerization subunit type 1 TsaB n=1 Tax=Roseateles sp. YR242 TaxID=1855305 RepID=UPI0008B3E5C6|nr:tRNA (adenosine(37)-N6)-threonylcarbamoyltransferase complex dimerization subunit type 1 TsaB [Roseateles sp. YR242]SEL49729.1 tRNA threonylcarbamoyladenosine biosynthesis protein TsaB [Roseateles sp. YR242]